MNFLALLSRSLDRLLEFHYFYTLFLYCLFFIFAALLISQIKPCLSKFKGLPKYLLPLFLFSLWLRFFVIEHRFCVLYDEFYFLNVSRNLYYNNAFGITLIGSALEPEKISFYGRPGAYPLLLSLYYRIAGASEQSAFDLTAILGSLIPALIYAIAFLIWNEKRTAFWAGFLAGLMPLYLKFSGCASADIPSLFFLLLGFALFLLYLKDRRISLLYCIWATLVWSSYMKPEYLLALAGLVFFVLKDRGIGRPDKELLVYSVAALCVPLLVQLPGMLRSESANAGSFFWGPVFFLKHLLKNTAYFFDPVRGSGFFGIAALPGILYSWKEKRREFYLLGGLFIAAVSVYSAYFAADLYQGAIRYGLPAASVLLVFSAKGLVCILERVGGKLRIAAAMLIAAFFFCQSFAEIKTWQAYMKNPFYQEIYFLREFAGRFMDSSLPIVTEDPAVATTVLDNRKVVGIDHFLNEKEPAEKAYIVRIGMRKNSEFSRKLNILRKTYRISIWQDIKIPPGAEIIAGEITKR